MINLENAIKRIRYYAFAEMGWSKKELSAASGVSEHLLRDIHKKDWNISLLALKKLEAIIPQEYARHYVYDLRTPNPLEDIKLVQQKGDNND